MIVSLIVFHLSAGSMEFDLASLASEYIVRNADKTYQCSLCGKEFRDMYNSKCHLDSVHFPSVNGYNCDICGKSCKSRHALSCHMSIYHRNK